MGVGETAFNGLPSETDEQSEDEMSRRMQAIAIALGTLACAALAPNGHLLSTGLLSFESASLTLRKRSRSTSGFRG